MNKPQEEAQKFLISHEVVSRRSLRQAQILGCIACRWNKTEEASGKPQVYGYEIGRCLQMNGGALYPILNRIEDAGIIQGEIEIPTTHGTRGALKRILSPAPTEAGEEFRELIIQPVDCPIEQNEV